MKSFVGHPKYIEFMKYRLQTFSSKNENGCWIWQRAKHRQGYGYISFEKKNILAHRLSWKLFRGELDPKILVCHRCDMPSCINPDHLFLGTYKDNNSDARMKKRNVSKPHAYKRKLKYEQVLQIIELSKQGVSRKELEKKFNVGQNCISKILIGKSWLINWDNLGGV